MRTLLFLTLAALTLLGLSPAAQAQARKVTIERVRVGLPVNQVQGEFKSGFWTPVYVDVTAGPEGLPRGGEIAVETSDCDDVRNNYHVLLPIMDPNERVAVMAYTKPSSVHSEMVTTVRVDNRNWQHREHYNSMQLGEVLLTTIGSRLPGLRRAYLPTAKPDEEEQFQRDTGPHRFASIDDLRELPNRWFGYDACDIMFLTTGNREFMTALASERDGRKEAILEWVRKGGRLVISAGKNQDILASIDANFGSFLPVSIAGTQQLPRLPLGRFGDPKSPDLLFPQGKVGQDGKPLQLELAKLVPKEGREFERLLPEETKADAPIYIARGAYGLGQVIVVGFDLDLPPFTTSAGQTRFWESFNSRIIKMPERTTNPQQRVGWPGNNTDEDVASQLQRKLEDFPDVPVVSFGWVALFILIYIIIVGPVDYFFLKKVVKRLELTWITFPTVVIVISVASYFIAYYLKGNDQLINKIDLVDIDQVGNQMYGHTWFTIFSPRIQHYTVGVEPAEGWATASPELRKADTVLVSWMGRPEMGFGGVNRASSQSLFRRSYDYMPDATGLRGVPIQVWTTKSFMSEWQTPIDPKRQPFKADLSEPVGGAEAVARLTGTITSRLPVELEDVYLLYRNNAYHLERLEPNTPKRVDNLFTNREAPTVSTWLNTTPTDPAPQVMAPRPGATAPRPQESSYATIKRIEFFRADTNAAGRADGAGRTKDSLLYNLDQSWRLGQKQGIILVGRMPRKQGAAETITRDSLSASQLWLGQLPVSGQPRPEIPGSLNQETYVRVFLPIKTGGDAAP